MTFSLTEKKKKPLQKRRRKRARGKESPQPMAGEAEDPMRTLLPARPSTARSQAFSHPSDVPTNRDRGHGRPARVGPTAGTIARSVGVERLQLSGCAWVTRRGHYGNCALLINAPHLHLKGKTHASSAPWVLFGL